jgi:hypothetical protein
MMMKLMHDHNLVRIRSEHHPISAGALNCCNLLDDFRGARGTHPVSPQMQLCKISNVHCRHPSEHLFMVIILANHDVAHPLLCIMTHIRTFIYLYKNN